MRTLSTTYVGALVLCSLTACGESSPSTPFDSSGGTSNSSGGSANGGSTTTANGGAAQGGATSANGGATNPSGGATATTNGGATNPSGGTASGGSTASGGAAAAGATAGGRANGGSSSGGASTSSGGSSSGGSTSTSGGSTAMAGASSTSGCGKTTYPPGDGSTLQTIDVSGTARQYILSLPTGYDPNKPYRVIFAWHGRTGTAAQIAGGGNRAFYGLKALLPDTIFVAGQGLGTATDAADTGWPNTNGQDIAMVRALVTYLSSNYCVDSTRLMSTGFSYGGIMSNTIGCQMSDVFRAIAPIAGAYFGRATSCNTHPIAYLGIHGTADDQVAYTAGETARDLFRTNAHCTTATTQPADLSPCVLYSGCDSGYPAYWCSHTGGHTVPSFSAADIAAFFKQF
ncbi:MAG: prolyl oligopeptidase family serine peptidase [Polyangiaceae bacterium]